MHAVTATGRRIYVDPADPRGERLVEADGDLNPGTLRLWRCALAMHPWDVVVDVGVNYGEMLVGVELPEGAEVIGFEPNPAVRELLALTLAESGVKAQIRPEAVSATAGTATFMVDSHWSGTSSLRDERHADSVGWRSLEVAVTTLDRVIDPGRTFCAKVDVEGFERDVVAGAADAMRSARHWAMLLEVAHMSRPYLAALAEERVVLLMDRRTGALVRVPGGNAELVDDLLAKRWLHAHDCLVVSDAVLAEIEG
ncbi:MULTISPECIES: FkbM family methyltransferase [unclassified Nocardioides]|uniref:FkbM family methyltransferase n=1 Tax=unclassified Nocardioides TaxID=2615069 RepID=UPI00360DA337